MWEEIRMNCKKINLDKTKNYIMDDNRKSLLKYLNKFEDCIMNEAYDELEYTAECFICRLRDILANEKQESRKEVLLKCANDMGIMVEKTGNIVEVTLPMILPTKEKAKAEFLFEPLFVAMENASSNKSFFVKEKAMMCIEFIYDKTNKNIPRGDHDNKEVKQVIDAISAFVLPDDSDNYLSLCQISSEGEYNHTKVYVMPEKDFGGFFLNYKNR